MLTTLPTPADLRALAARKQVRWYKVAAQVDMNPSRLAAMIGGRLPLPPDLAARVARVLDEYEDGGA